MFQTSDVKIYLKSIKLDSEDDKRTARLRLFVTPITYELAREASEGIADRLFRENGKGYHPVLEMGTTEFLVNIPVQSMSYRRHPTYPGHEVLVPDVKIDKLSAQKLIDGDPNFSLLFDVSFEILDKTVVTDLVDLLHENFYVTFAPLQPGLFPPKNEWEGLLCRLCEAPNPEWGVEGSKPKLAYCSGCKKDKQDDEKLVRIADHATARAAVKEDEPPKSEDPLLKGADINKRASQRQRGKGRR